MREPARTRQQAFERYRRYLQLALSCLDATAQWYASGGKGSDCRALLVQPGAVPLLRESGERLYLSASQLFSFVGDQPQPGEWKIRTHEYVYSITPDENLAGKLLGWHWHPHTRPDPHVHVHAGHEALGVLGALHLPTSRVSFESVVRFLIADLCVRPARRDWDSLLADTEQRFLESRTWHHTSTPQEF